MRKIILLVISAFPALAMGQNVNYVLKGKIGQLNAPAKVYLNHMVAGKAVMDSVILKSGAFSFKGTTDGISLAVLSMDHTGAGYRLPGPKTDGKVVYLEEGTVTLTSADSIKTAVITGSPVNKELAKYNLVLKIPNDSIRAANNEYYRPLPTRKPDQAYLNEILARQDKWGKERVNLQKKYIAENPNSYFSLVALKEVATKNPDGIEPLFKGLSENIRKTNDGVTLATLLEGWKKTAIGVLAPDFTQNDLNGKPVKLSDFKGKYILLDFWASWCGPCRDENPNVVKVYNQYKDKNFTVLGVSLDSPSAKDAWIKAVKEDGLIWTQVCDLKNPYNEVATMYAIQAIPQNFLIDPSGKIVAKNLRGEDLAKKLAMLMPN